MPTNIVIHSWRGTDALIDAAKQGYQTILSNGYYIDLIQPTDFHYVNDPIPKNAELSAEEMEKILGGEATMWSEFVSWETVDSRIWPRTAAIAERLWSPRNVNDIDYMYERLDKIGYLLEEHGLTHLKNHEMMLRRLTDNQDIEPLRVLISIIEPVKIYNRNRLRKQTQQTPLTRVVDAAVPDAKEARLFRKAVSEFIKDPDKKVNSGYISEKLELWKNNHLHLLPVISNSPILFEIETLSQNLSQLSKLGEDLVSLIKDGTKPDEIWRAKARQIIENVKNPVAQTEIMIIPAIENLYDTLN
jgi:hexosaminidase